MGSETREGMQGKWRGNVEKDMGEGGIYGRANRENAVFFFVCFASVSEMRVVHQVGGREGNDASWEGK